MKLRDAVWGALLLVLAGALLVHVRGFPAMPGQRIGPAVMPALIAVGLGACGALLLLRDLRAGLRAAPWAHRPAWAASRRHVVALAVLVGINVFYLLAVSRLGFVLTGVVYLGTLMLALGVRPARAAVVAVVATLAIHAAFYKLLKVPLPWGVLQGVAW